MAYSSQIDPHTRLGIVTLSGTVDGRDLVEAIAALYSHPGWEPDFDVLWDASAIVQLILDPNDIERIMARASEKADRMGDGRTALVVARDLDNTIARLLLHRQRPDQRERRLFDQRDQALTWLRGEAESDADAASEGEAA